MNKIVVMIISLMFVFQVNAGATAFVSKSDDPFEGDYSVYTTSQIDPFEFIQLEKKVYPSYKKYETEITMPYYYIYSAKSVQIKIDDGIYDLNILKQNKYLDFDTRKISFISEIPASAIDAIKNANKIMIRVVGSNNEKYMVDFNAKDITDWKDVINTEK